MSTQPTQSAELSNHQDSTDGVSTLEGEHVLANVHPSWANWPKSIVLAGIFVLGALAGIAGGDIGTFFGSIVVTALILGYVYLSRTRSRYVVTNQRVMKKIGLLRTTSGECRVADIKSLTTDQGIIEKILGKGSVQIDSTGAGGTLAISGVSNHQELADIIREQQQKVA